MNNNRVLLIVAVAAIVVVLAGSYIANHNDDDKTPEGDDLNPILLTFSFDESVFDVSAEGKVIRNGSVFTFNSDSEIDVKSKVGRINIGYDGAWSDSYGGSGGASGNELGTSCTIYIVNTAYFGEQTGTMNIFKSNE